MKSVTSPLYCHSVLWSRNNYYVFLGYNFYSDFLLLYYLKGLFVICFNAHHYFERHQINPNLG